MNPIQNTKKVICVPPQLVDNGDVTGLAAVDVSGFGHARFEWIIGATDAALGSTDEATAPKIEHCDTAGGSYADVTGAELSGVIGATDDDKIFAIDIDLNRQAYKKFMRPAIPHAADGTNGVNVCVTCTLSKPGIGPVDAAGQGLEEQVVV